MNFEYPFILFALMGLPFLWLYIKKNEYIKTAAIKFSDGRKLPAQKSRKVRFRSIPLLLRMLALGCCIVALARPIEKNNLEIVEGQGIDIILCVDVSGSMLSQDLKPDRLTAAKKVALDFIERRKGDRIGLVIFSGESFTLCPLTTDKAVLKLQINNIAKGILKDGTVIGAGLATAVDRLKSSTAKSKIVILMTDGEDNGGSIDPQTAKEIAKTFGVRVYTIGVGTKGVAPYPYETPMGTQMVNEKVSIDEDLLKQIASETSGQYYRATDNEELQKIYASIDKLEKSKVQSTVFTHQTEKFQPWVLTALILVFFSMGLQLSVFRKFP